MAPLGPTRSTSFGEGRAAPLACSLTAAHTALQAAWSVAEWCEVQPTSLCFWRAAALTRAYPVAARRLAEALRAIYVEDTDLFELDRAVRCEVGPSAEGEGGGAERTSRAAFPQKVDGCSKPESVVAPYAALHVTARASE
jgi:hypothetical protein